MSDAAPGPGADQVQTGSASMPPGRSGLLAMIDVTDRHGSLVARLPVTRWPVTVGRALDADLVLDEVHVAGQHLRLTQTMPGFVSVQVLDTHNGVTLGRQHHGRAAVFDWHVGQPLVLGRLHLRLRLAGSPLPDEEPLPRAPWRAALRSVSAVAVMLLLTLGQLWLKNSETQNPFQQLPLFLPGALAVLGLWSGLWALASKLFSGHPQFWRHVRIASLTFVASEVVELFAQVVAFAFSWENIGRFSHLGVILVAALGIYRHLRVVVPQPRRGLAVGMLLALSLGLPAMLGTQWLKNKRLSNQLYMSQLFPPSWRLAAPVSVAQFLQQAEDIEQRLAQRLQDRDDEDAPDKSPGDDE